MIISLAGLARIMYREHLGNRTRSHRQPQVLA